MKSQESRNIRENIIACVLKYVVISDLITSPVTNVLNIEFKN